MLKQIMKFNYASFGKIEIDGKHYNRDVVVDRGNIVKREKGKSRSFKAEYGHTPLTPHENIPWECTQLIIGTGFYGSLPVADALQEETSKRGIELKIMTTAEACKYLESKDKQVNAVLHLTC